MIFSISESVLVTGSVLPQRSLPENAIAGRWLSGFSSELTQFACEFFRRRLVGLFRAAHLCTLPFLAGELHFRWCWHDAPRVSGPVMMFETFA